MNSYGYYDDWQDFLCMTAKQGYVNSLQLRMIIKYT